MKRIILTILLTVVLSCILKTAAYSWVYVDTSRAPGLPIQGFLGTIQDIDNIISKNFKNYAGSFALANVGGYPVGDAYLGKFPHMYFGVSATIGCANMKYYDEDVAREKSVYPAYTVNPVINFGFGLAGGFDLLFKFLIFSDAMYKPPIDTASAKLSKFNIYSLGGKLRKNLIEKTSLIPGIFGFGGFTVSVGADFMEGIIAIDGRYKYTLNNVYVNPPGAYFNLTLDAFYNFNIHWRMMAGNAQALVYFNLFWIFDVYTGAGLSLTYGFTRLDGSGIGLLSNTTLGNVGNIFAMVSYYKRPRAIMGLYIAGLEINLWILKITAETMVNLSNGSDINLQLGTRFQF
jgi:hypothetical protein